MSFELGISAGELRDRITFQRPAAAQDEMGGGVSSWETVVTLSAKTEPRTGRELDNAAQKFPEADVRFTLRYYPGLSTEMRIVDEAGNPHDIVNIADVENRHKKLDIMATRVPIGRNA